MKNTSLTKAIVTIMLLCSISCSNSTRDGKESKGSSPETQIDNSEDYFPLSIGEKREYTLIYSTPFKNVQGKALMKVESVEPINGKEYYKVVYIYSGIPGLESETYFYRKSTGGFYVMKKINDALSNEYLDIKLPLETGTSWVSSSPDGESNWTAKGKETLELIDHKYEDCFKIIMKTKDGRSGYMYLCKGIGLVKQFVSSANGNESWEYTLVK